MKKYDYYKKYTFLNPNMPYNAFWWSNSTTDYHRHVDFYEMFLTVQEGSVHIYNDEVVKLSSHTLCIIPSMQYHAIENAHTNQMPIILTLGLAKNFLERHIDTFSPSLIDAMNGKECIYLKADDVTYDFLLLLANRATYDEDENKRLQAVKLFLATAASMYEMRRSFSYSISPQQAYALDIKTKIDNLEYLGDVSAIYEKYPIAPSILIRNFKKLTGQTIISYQVTRRIKYACTLLTNTDYPVLQICSLVGYDSLSHFIENFKKFTGTTPTSYRKNNTNTILPK